MEGLNEDLYSCLLGTKLLRDANGLVLQMAPTQTELGFHKLNKVCLCCIHFTETKVLKRIIIEIEALKYVTSPSYINCFHNNMY